LATDKTPDFEKSLKELEEIVYALEVGDLSLEESLKTFERGIKLTRNCQSALEHAEQRVSILLERNNESVREPFDNSDLN